MTQGRHTSSTITVSDSYEALERIRANSPATTPADIREQWNLIQQAIALVDPRTDQLDAILAVLNEIQRLIQAGEVPSPSPPESQPPAELPEQLPGQVAEQFTRLSEDVTDIRRDVGNLLRGQILSTALPIGRIGIAQDELKQGQAGTGQFDILGMPFQVEITAGQAISQFEKIVITGDGNQAKPAPEEVQDASGVDIAGTGPRTGRTVTAGVENAVVLDLGGLIQEFEVFYKVATNDGDIRVEKSHDAEDETWRLHKTVQVSPGGEQDWFMNSTTYRHIRVYASDGFDEGDVDVVEVSAKGL